MLAAFADISLLQILLVACVALIGSIVGGVAGYGTGALMPLVLVPIVGPEPVVPIIAISGLLTAQVFGVVRLDIGHALALTAGAAVADGLLLLAAVRLFDRETILTRWR